MSADHTFKEIRNNMQHADSVINKDLEESMHAWNAMTITLNLNFQP